MSKSIIKNTTDMVDPYPEFKILQRQIMKSHLEQLRRLELSESPVKEPPILASFDDLVRWTDASKAQIDQGISNRVYGGPFGSKIDFNNVFMAFMESAAVYLRDTSKVLEAVNIYRTNGDSDEAFILLENSTSQIQELASMWGMFFVDICDFVTIHPDGHSWIVGPFCGVFIPKDYKTSDKPFLGVSFKGTGSFGEIINDLAAMSTVSPPSWLWQSQVAKGFFYPIFSIYEKTPSLMPFTMIRQAIQDFANGSKTTIVAHITGHSLGGAYSTLSYAELSIEDIGTPKAFLGDLYTFGAPRVGRQDFAVQFRDAVHSGTTSKGSPWRIVNNKDVVPKVPASPIWPFSDDPYVHIDTAYKIYPDKMPKLQPSEIGTHPTWPLITAVRPHFTTEYYKSLAYATTGRSPNNAMLPPRQWESPAVTAVANNSEEIASKEQVVEVKFTFESYRGYIVGTITYGSFVGEIAVMGSFVTNVEGKAYMYFDSWKDIYRKSNSCDFKRVSNGILILTLISDDAAVAFVNLPISFQHTGEVRLTGGTCNWTFDENEKIVAVGKSLTEASAKAVAELFTT